MRFQLPKLSLPGLPKLPRRYLVWSATAIVIASLTFLGRRTLLLSQQVSDLQQELATTNEDVTTTQERLASTSAELADLQNQDQVKINQELKANLQNIKNTYSTAVSSYEDLLKLKEQAGKTQELEELYTRSLLDLVKEDYRAAQGKLSELAGKIEAEQTRLAAASVPPPQNVPESSSPPGSGYSRQSVPTDAGSFLVTIVAADLNSTRVIVDTAADSDCHNDCPVLSLASYVARNGAFAGVNGSYFCPAAYPSCAGKNNTFDTLAMNRNQVYFNSDNNVYSTIPAVIFGSGWVRFVGQSLEWGRDTSVDGVLANKPLLVSGGNIVFTGGGEAKEGARGGRSFVANQGSQIYIGVVHNATVAESAKVMKALGMENALNLDDGGSTALWYGGYKVGPGRDLPNVILFVRK